MARKTASRMQKRREVEAASSRKKTTKKKKAAKKTEKKRATKRKSAAPVRLRLMWGVFSSTLKEEARFPYEQKKEAEQKLAQLLARGKRLYFMQPIKEPITDTEEESEGDK